MSFSRFPPPWSVEELDGYFIVKELSAPANCSVP